MNYLRNKWGRQLNSSEMMPLLGFRHGQHIPLDHESTHEFCGADESVIRVIVRKSRGGSSARIFYECTCGRLVPYGRIVQHLKARGHP